MTPTGFIDLQINGHKGIHFSRPGLTADQVRTATRLLAEAGTLAYCPTVVTAPLATYRSNLPLLAEAMRDPELKGRVLGIHLEGPFISPAEGARGAHPPDHIVKPDPALLRQFQDWADGRIVLLTVAPELPGVEDLIREARRLGMAVSLGHHLGDPDAITRAIEAGATACTHLGNGMPNMIHRHQNPVWRQLADDRLTGMLITDGHHLPSDFIKVALRAKTAARTVVVSDATDLAGLPPGVYDFQNAKVELLPSGRIQFSDTPYLAGSSATMTQCMNHLASLDLLSENELWQVGFFNPLRLIGVPPEAVAPTLSATVVYRNSRFALRA